MKRIILASGSVQRKKLLQLLGVKFTVQPSGVPEVKKIKTTCTDLVKHNALIKAQDVAAKSKNAIVIGADTVVYIGNKQIIGKPKDLKDAKRILKILFAKPHWVYTGVVVIDTATGKKVIDYEKTKVFMTPLSDEEIDRYHQNISPLDKAGGFDIEGWGSLFINRIEGCYSNVIGLPMSKLCHMLKKVGVSVLGLLLMINIMGCATEYNLATQREETLIYGDEKEIHLGEAMARSIELHYKDKIFTEVDANERVERILKRITEVCDRTDIVYFIKIIDEDEMNAVSLPGGYIYVFKKLVEKVDNDDQLAGVIAHEVGHITAKHAIKKLQEAYGAMLFQLAVTQTPARNVSGGLNFALTSLFMSHSQEDEFQADELGVKYMKAAGYNPLEMTNMLRKLQQEQDKSSLRQYSYWRTHPHIPERVAAVNTIVSGKMEFKDYIKMIGRDEK